MKHPVIAKSMDMNMEGVISMIGGTGATSYAANSRLQEKEMIRTKPLVEEAVKEVFMKTKPENLVVADLGCSSGPNTFLLLSMIVNALSHHCNQLGQKPPEMQCFLNDLPGNDFNSLFKNLKFLKTKIEQEQEQGKEETLSVPNYYVMGIPGTIYGRLFPSNSVHFFHSSFCLHWCSKVPVELKNEEIAPSNKRNIYIAKTSTPDIIKSYHEQFKSDFSKFLDMRHEELAPGGRMVLTYIGRECLDARYGETSFLFGLLADALNSMVLEGLLEEDKIEKFNLPMYMPCTQEVKEVIINRGLFSVHQLYTTVANLDPYYDCDNNKSLIGIIESGKNVAKMVRAAMEPVLASHFGHIIMDDLFTRFAVNVANHLFEEKGTFTIIVASLVK